MGAIEQIEARREARRKALAEARDAAKVADMEALDKAEEEHGADRVLSIDVTSWAAGLATMVVARVPLGSEAVFKRFEQETVKAKPGSTTRLDAAHKLARACIVHPAGDALDAVVDAAPGILSNVAAEITLRAQGRAAEEEKG